MFMVTDKTLNWKCSHKASVNLIKYFYPVKSEIIKSSIKENKNLKKNILKIGFYNPSGH